MIKLDLTLKEGLLFYKDQNDVHWCADDVRRLRRQAIGRNGSPRKMRVEVSCLKIKNGIKVERTVLQDFYGGRWRSGRLIFGLIDSQVEALSPLLELKSRPKVLWVRFK